ncbi:hypothetical protein B0H13DRAFT_2307179 [Mycena leptocephala]|nr:hypothetical protein B0H13DRAFT_2307179 [Mycena leptocephala]
MEESRIDTGDEQAYELLSLSPDLFMMALHRRIGALEAIIKNMEQALETKDHRIAVLEAMIKKESAATITPWRLLNTVFVLGVGAYKAVATYLGQTTGPTTADWIIGVAWALFAYWVSFFDDPTPNQSSWFFTRDVSRLSGKLLGLVLAGLYLSPMLFANFERQGNIGAPITLFLFGMLSPFLLNFYATVTVKWLLVLGRQLCKLRLPHFLRGLFDARDWYALENIVEGLVLLFLHGVAAGLLGHNIMAIVVHVGEHF